MNLLNMESSLKNSVQSTKLKNLIDGLRKIFLKESTQLSFVQGYSDCYMIVTQNFGEDLYNSTNNIISEHLRARVQPLVTQDLCNNRLEVINKNWEDLDACARKVHDILLFLDFNYAKPKSLLEVYEMVLVNFRNLIIRDQVVSEAMRHVMFGMIIAERQGAIIDYSAIKTAVNLLLHIGEQINPFSEYDKIFEEYFLENSKLFYKREAQDLLQQNNAIEYIKTFEKRLAEEKERVSRYLHQRTESKILDIVEHTLIKDNLDNIIHLENGLSWMIQENCLPELEKLYQFYKKYAKINELNIIIGQCFSVYVNSIIDCVGGDIDVQEKSKVIEDVLNLKIKFNNIANICFENNIELKAIVDNMFTLAMSSRAKTSQYLACYIHEKMRKFEKNISENEIDKELDQFIELFHLVIEKDVFEKYANANLAKRLLSRRANLDIEKKFIGKLQLECGTEYIKSLKNKTEDITINEDHMNIFKDQMTTNNIQLPEIDFSIYVLRKLSWPKFEQFPPINLPESMNRIYELYLKCYKDKHEGRKVTLQCNMGTTQIKAKYEEFQNKKKREYILEGTTLHAVVLDLFNAHDNLSFNHIQDKTNIPEKSLNILFTDLIKNQILNTEFKDSGIKIYSVNLGFFSKNRKYKIKAGKCIDTAREESKKIDERIEKDRCLEIEAVIVRIMKTRKTLKVTNLEVEVIEMLKKRFQPSVQLIKKKIKDLIAREYIAYAKDDATTFIYLE